ncbi:hypothetical protein BX600DRAFT_494826 [Xylariales sp. PMI_506]|nr:hypothetical protein BX600DRAFT_494826 [Xylariales sp. PMI_506]
MAAVARHSMHPLPDEEQQQHEHEHEYDQVNVASIPPPPNEGSVEASIAPLRKRKRVKTGCLTCRARKVKCDETHPKCNNCLNLDVQCRWPEGSGPRSLDATHPLNNTSSSLPSQPHTNTIKAGGSGIRSPACFTCRYARSKCSQTHPSCARCLLYGYECKYPEPKRSRVLTSSAESWMKRFSNGNEVSRHGVLPATAESGHDQATGSFPNQSDTAVRSPRTTPSPRHDFQHHPGSAVRPSTAYDSFNPFLNDNFQFQTTSTPGSHLDSAAESSVNEHQSLRDDSLGTLPSQERIEQLAASFFKHVHIYRANAFLHRDKTLIAIREGTINKMVLLALCAVGARFAVPPEPEELAMGWATEAGNRLTTSIEASRHNVATALLITTYMQQAGRFAQSHLWAAVAMNQALSLSLHHEAAPGTRTFVESEYDRRLFFACYAVNRFISNGAPESIQCPASRIKLRLPCDGFNYRMDIGVETPYAVLETDDSHMPEWMYKNVGAMGFWVRLVGARVMIKRYFNVVMESREGLQSTHAQPGTTASPNSINSIQFSPVAPWNPNSSFDMCMKKLATLRESLPSRLQLSRELVLRRHDSPVLGQMVMFYLWWNECHIELCSVVLQGYPQSLDEDILSTAPEGWVDQTRQRGLRHAQAITDILDLVEKELAGQQPMTIYDHTIAHAVYLSIRVQLELTSSGSGDTAARELLKDRFEMMLGFVERISAYFRPVYLVLKEMRRMLAVHDMSSREFQDNESRPETPPLPWFKRQKSLDSKRMAEKAAIDAANLEAILLELLPDCTTYATAPWIRDYDVEGSYLNSVSQGSNWQTSGLSNGVAGLTSTELGTMGRMSSETEIPRFDPFLPKVTMPSYAAVSVAPDLIPSTGPYTYNPMGT